MDTQPTPQPQQTQPQAQAANSNGAIQTEVQYSVGLLAKPAKAVISYDGNGLIQLVDSTTNTAVFSKHIHEMGKVTRAEYALYMTVPGIPKKVTVMFGNAKRYITENAAGMPFGVTGAVGGVLRSNQMNKESGIEHWVAIFKANGKISNFSPNMVVVVAVILGILIVGISMLSYFFQ